jgi:hypothetical protein
MNHKGTTNTENNFLLIRTTALENKHVIERHESPKHLGQLAASGTGLLHCIRNDVRVESGHTLIKTSITSHNGNFIYVVRNEAIQHCSQSARQTQWI